MVSTARTLGSRDEANVWVLQCDQASTPVSAGGRHVIVGVLRSCTSFTTNQMLHSRFGDLFSMLAAGNKLCSLSLLVHAAASLTTCKPEGLTTTPCMLPVNNTDTHISLRQLLRRTPPHSNYLPRAMLASLFDDSNSPACSAARISRPCTTLRSTPGPTRQYHSVRPAPNLERWVRSRVRSSCLLRG